MILVDTSVWISHLQFGDKILKELLLEEKVMCHPFVVGELACGNIKNRKEILSLFQDLPSTPIVSQEEFHYFIETQKLMGIGIGFVDIHLLASCKLLNIFLWTEDKRLNSTATNLGVSYSHYSS